MKCICDWYEGSNENCPVHSNQVTKGWEDEGKGGNMRHEVAILLLLGISLAGFGLIYLAENIDNHVSESPAQVEKYEHENIHMNTAKHKIFEHTPFPESDHVHMMEGTLYVSAHSDSNNEADIVEVLDALLEELGYTFIVIPSKRIYLEDGMVSHRASKVEIIKLEDAPKDPQKGE